MISVCIPTYNGEKFIKQQLDSILIQLGKDDEVIISDDSSTDHTVEIIKNINDPRITLIGNCTFQSPVFNLENALKKAKGDYIFLSDQDDVWLPEKVNKCLDYLNEKDAVLTDCTIVNESLDIINNSLFEINKSKPGLINNLLKNSYSGACMAFKNKILKIALPFPHDIPMHDIWLGFIIELFFKPIFINDKLLLHRVHNNNMTYTATKSKYSFFKKILFRLNILKYIPLLIVRRFIK